AGCFSGGTDLVALFVLHGLFKLELVFSTSVAFVLSFLISFTLQKFWTFRNNNQARLAHQLGLYILTAFIGLNINGASMHVLVNSLGVWYLLAQLIVNLFLGIINFVVYKFIIFKKK
ncbi:MAG: GtrA family protein, partial [Candidatus Falkowbacteria bacterium]|nr:GtrA family protein [Candidatus Falkowbacteria bacterium]